MHTFKIKRKPHFNQHQIQRILTQIVASFAGYQVETGNQRDGKTRMRDVPVIYGDQDRVTAYITGPRSNVENTVSYIPFMSVFMTSIEQIDEKRQNANFTGMNRVHELARDANGELLVNVPGERKVVEWHMPTPYRMGISLSIWASNNHEGYQLITQLMTAYNPDQEITFSNSPTDPTYLSNLVFQGKVGLKKANPVGGETNPLYVYQLDFTVDVWISIPNKVYKQKPILEIDMDIHDYQETIDLYADVLETLQIRVTDDELLVFEQSEVPDPQEE